jgi:AraC family transcriptional regulator
MRELSLLDTNGILCQPWVRPDRTSAGLGWSELYVSAQHELPYQAGFEAAASHLIILHRSGPVTVRRGHLGLSRSRIVPVGGFFVHPAGKDLTVELGGELDTVHVYVSGSALRDVELIEELGVVDPLMEQLVLALDALLTRWEPAARTYVDQLGNLLAGHLARRHSAQPPTKTSPRCGLTDRQLSGVLDLIEARLAEPIPLAEMAAVAGLSVSQFSRQFKHRLGVAPHQYLLWMRADAAFRLLQSGTDSIAEVAARCGFTHQEHLTRVVHKQFGTTPAAIRRTG